MRQVVRHRLRRHARLEFFLRDDNDIRAVDFGAGFARAVETLDALNRSGLGQTDCLRVIINAFSYCIAEDYITVLVVASADFIENAGLARSFSRISS